MFALRYKAGVPSIDEILSLRRYKLRKTPHFQRPNPPLVHVPPSWDRREFCEILPSGLYNSKRGSRSTEPHTRDRTGPKIFGKKERVRTKRRYETAMFTNWLL